MNKTYISRTLSTFRQIPLDLTLPVQIFSKNLAPLEAVVWYLHHKGFTNRAIAKSLNRSEKTISAAWTRAKVHPPHLSHIEHYTIPLKKFSKDKLSILETVVHHLQTTDKLANKDIAAMLRLDPRVISTLKSRYQRKLREVNHA